MANSHSPLFYDLTVFQWQTDVQYFFVCKETTSFCLQPIRATLPHTGEILSLHVSSIREKYTVLLSSDQQGAFLLLLEELPSLLLGCPKRFVERWR